MEITSREDVPFGIHAVFERIVHPPRGRDGGHPGMVGRLNLASGAKLKGKGFQVIPAGERLVVEMPGGGGFGDPATRDPVRVQKDVRHQLVSRDVARTTYKVVLRDDLSVDADATAALRNGEG